MKKMFKRTTAIAASALMLTQMVPYNVFAEPAVTGPNKLTIYPYMVSETTYNGLASPDDDPTGKPGDADRADYNGDLYDGDEPMTFSIVKIEADGTPSTTTPYSGTATQGVKLSGLPNGYYKITPNNPTTEAGEDYNFKDAEAFCIELPSAADGDINDDVSIYPKLTNNADTKEGEEKDPETPGDDPAITPNKHSIKLKKSLSSGDWEDTTPAVFNIFYEGANGEWVNAGDFETDDHGVILVDGLALGKYYAVEKTAPDGYLLDKKPIEFNLDGSGLIENQVKEFVNDKTLTAAKVIDVDGKGEDYNWTITTDIPSKAYNLVSYIVTDTFTSTLTDVNVESVMVGSSVVDEEDYTVDDSQNGKVIVKIDDMTALAGGSALTIKVSSKIGTYSSGNVTNSASLKYQYAYDPDEEDTIPDDIPGIVEPEPYDPEDPTAAYPDPIETDTASDSFTPATIKIKNVDGDGTELPDGKYDITGFSEHNDAEDDGDTTDNILTFSNIAPGHYTIKQTGTKSGYFIDTDNPKYIYIDKAGNVYLTENATATTGDLLTNDTESSNEIVFTNLKTATGFELPFTGTTATIVFTVTGIAIMAGAAFFIIILFKKRDEEEEEQKNA